MADKKISALTSLSPVDDDDLIVVVDVSDTTMASSGTTKKAIKSELKGDKGEDGASIIDAEFSGDDIRFIKDDNTDVILEDAKIELKGEKGDAGVGAEVVTSFGTPTSDEKVPSEKLTKDSLDAKQETLVSGTNIKTINSTSILGSGDITISSPSKATGTELDTGTDDAKFATAKAIKDAHNVPSVAPGTSGNVLTSDGTDWVSATPSSSASFWTLMPGSPTRTSNTTFTITGDYTNLIGKGMVIKWTESSTVKNAMVSIASTYSSPNTTVTIIGDTMSSIDANSLKYAQVEARVINFAIAGTIGTTATDVANAYYAMEPMRVFGADLQVGTAGTTNNTTIDINKGGTTMFTTKPTLASTVAASTSPYTANNGTSLALNDKVTIDIDAVQSTPAVDLYVELYVWATRYNYLT